MHDLAQDLRYAARALRRRPAFTMAVVLTLGLGIGANTTMFGLVSAALFRPAGGVVNPETLVWITSTTLQRPRSGGVSYPDYRDLVEANDVFSHLAAYARTPLSLGGDAEPERIEGEVVTGDYFATLGVRPAVGRLFVKEDDAPGAPPVIVLSHRLWVRRFGGDPSIVGRAVSLSGRPFTVAGVAAEAFDGPQIDRRTDGWIPITTYEAFHPRESSVIDARGATWLTVIGRRKPSMTADRVEDELRQISAGLNEAHPEVHQDLRFVTTRFGGLDPSGRGDAVPLSIFLMGIVGMVLLVACANVTNLLLARAAARRKETAVRIAIGASRGRLVRQLLVESALLSVLGAAAALVFSLWAGPLVSRIVDTPDLPRVDLAADSRVLWFTLATALVTAFAFGLAPALSATRPDLTPALKDEAGERGTKRSRLQSGLVIAQVALSLTLLAAAGLFLRSLHRVRGAELGFEPRNVLTVSFDLSLQGYTREQAAIFQRLLTERIQSLPEVEGVASTALVPMSGRVFRTPAYTESAAGAESVQPSMVSLSATSPGYFAVLRLPLERGRDFGPKDVVGAPAVAIVNARMAELFWPAADPIGKLVSVDGPTGPWAEVIGVAENAVYDEVGEDDQPFLYLAQPQQTDELLSATTLLVRARSEPSRVLPHLEREVRALDRDLPLFGIGTLEQNVRNRADKQIGISRLLGLFGGLALLLAAVGLYGVMAYVVAQRTREIGIRMALGARASEVLALVLGDGGRLAGWGILTGCVLAFPLTKLLSSALYGVTPLDLAAFAGAALVVGGVSLAAALVPARRAARLDPLVALRRD